MDPPFASENGLLFVRDGKVALPIQHLEITLEDLSYFLTADILGVLIDSCVQLERLVISVPPRMCWPYFSSPLKVTTSLCPDMRLKRLVKTDLRSFLTRSLLDIWAITSPSTSASASFPSASSFASSTPQTVEQGYISGLGLNLPLLSDNLLTVVKNHVYHLRVLNLSCCGVTDGDANYLLQIIGLPCTTLRQLAFRRAYQISKNENMDLFRIEWGCVYLESLWLKGLWCTAKYDKASLFEAQSRTMLQGDGGVEKNAGKSLWRPLLDRSRDRTRLGMALHESIFRRMETLSRLKTLSLDGISYQRIALSQYLSFRNKNYPPTTD